MAQSHVRPMAKENAKSFPFIEVMIVVASAGILLILALQKFLAH